MNESFYKFRRTQSREERLQLVRSSGGRDYYIDRKHPERGEFFLFRGATERPVAVLDPVAPPRMVERYEVIDGVRVKITTYTSYQGEGRSIAHAGAGQSLGNGGYKKGHNIT